MIFTCLSRLGTELCEANVADFSLQNSAREYEVIYQSVLVELKNDAEK